jgi:hypothetical protein
MCCLFWPLADKSAPTKAAQASELMGYVRELTIIGLMDEKPMMH